MEYLTGKSEVANATSSNAGIDRGLGHLVPKAKVMVWATCSAVGVELTSLELSTLSPATVDGRNHIVVGHAIRHR